MSSGNGSPAIDAVVFDVGGVLLDWDPRHLYRKLFDDGEEMDRFLDEVCTLEWHAAHDRGMPVEQSCAALATKHPEHADLIWAWAHRGEEMIAGPIAGSVEILRELKDRGVPCYALTNMEAGTYPGRLHRFEFLQWFDGTVVSAFEGTAKPDVVIFLRLLDRFGLKPSTTVMIDDSAANLEVARSLGMHTVQFRSVGQLRRSLEELRLLEPRE
jgi:HAD superfamily hydrolase (TIGR01509 family)